jgi:hypothetical protein
LRFASFIASEARAGANWGAASVFARQAGSSTCAASAGESATRANGVFVQGCCSAHAIDASSSASVAIYQTLLIQRRDEFGRDRLVAYAVRDDVGSGGDHGLRVGQIMDMRGDPQAEPVAFRDDGAVNVRAHLHGNRAAEIVDPDLDQIGAGSRHLADVGARLVGGGRAVKLIGADFHHRLGGRPIGNADALVHPKKVGRKLTLMGFPPKRIEQRSIVAERYDCGDSVSPILSQFPQDRRAGVIGCTGACPVDLADMAVIRDQARQNGIAGAIEDLGSLGRDIPSGGNDPTAIDHHRSILDRCAAGAVDDADMGQRDRLRDSRAGNRRQQQQARNSDRHLFLRHAQMIE